MGSIVLQEHEKAPLFAMYQFYDLNTEARGMTPNPHSPFGRSPAPKIWPDDPLESNQVKRRVEKRLGLAWHWECTLFGLEEARLYDGTEASAEAFEKQTCLAPLRFAQGWLEVHNGPWKTYHLVKADDGPALVKAMCEFWAAKTKHWRTVSADQTRANLKAKVGEENLAYAQTHLVARALPNIMSVGGRDREQMALLKSLKANGNFDCIAHPMAPFCRCPAAFDVPISYDIKIKTGFVDSWDMRLVGTDDAFLFANDTASSTLFKVRMDCTPANFASRHVDYLPAFWEPATTKLALVEAMLAYWASLGKVWRETCKTRREVRTKATEDMRGRGESHVVSKTTGIAMPEDPHDAKMNKDPLCRYVKLPGPVGHQGTAVLYAKSGRGGEGNFGYEILRTTPCHAACVPAEPQRVDMGRLTAAFVKADVTRAKAVKAEW